MESRVRDLELTSIEHAQRISASEAREGVLYERYLAPMAASFDKMSEKIARQEARMAYIMGAAAVASAVIGSVASLLVSAAGG